MPHALVYGTNRNQSKTSRIMEPIAEGLRRAGYTITWRESIDYPEGDEGHADLLAIWGDYYGSERIYADHAGSRRLLHIDNGYLGRGHFDGYYSVTLGAKQATDAAWQYWPFPPDRREKLDVTCTPWRRHGDRILVLGLSRKQCENLHFAYPGWNKHLQDEVRHVSHRPVVLREKRYDQLQPPLPEILLQEDWRLVVGYNSKGLIEALVAGIPILALGPCAAAALDSADLHRLTYSDDREAFLAWLAYQQWTLTEIAQGAPWIG